MFTKKHWYECLWLSVNNSLFISIYIITSRLHGKGQGKHQCRGLIYNFLLYLLLCSVLSLKKLVFYCTSCKYKMQKTMLHLYRSEFYVITRFCSEFKINVILF